jgi:hypothetical protein
MLSLYYAIVDFIVTSLRPPEGASTTKIRKAGAVTGALGLVLLALTVAGVALLISRVCSLETAVKVATPFWLAGFAATILGAFRLVLATEPDQMSAPKRMALGVVFGCGSLVLLVGLGILVAVIVHYAQSPTIVPRVN